MTEQMFGVEFDDDAPVIVLARRDEGDPGHCVHGYTTCMSCHAEVLLGDQSIKIVLDGKAMPICKPCAIKHGVNEGNKVGNAFDAIDPGSVT